MKSLQLGRDPHRSLKPVTAAATSTRPQYAAGEAQYSCNASELPGKWACAVLGAPSKYCCSAPASDHVGPDRPPAQMSSVFGSSHPLSKDTYSSAPRPAPSMEFSDIGDGASDI